MKVDKKLEDWSKKLNIPERMKVYIRWVEETFKEKKYGDTVNCLTLLGFRIDEYRKLIDVSKYEKVFKEYHEKLKEVMKEANRKSSK